MHDNRSHPLLAQVPLTVSPFVSLPTATTLPYTYKSLPSSLPPSSTGPTASTGEDKAQYVVSPSGHTAHPNGIIASCTALKDYIQKLKDEAVKELKAWEGAIYARDLAEKRRVAPGWLDSDARILEPEKKASKDDKSGVGQNNLMDVDVSSAEVSALRDTPVVATNGEGDELDRAFGGLGLGTLSKQ